MLEGPNLAISIGSFCLHPFGTGGSPGIATTGGFLIFFSRPISGTLLFIAIALLAAPLLPWFRRRRPGADLEPYETT